MSVENTNTIDFVSLQENRLILTISDHLEWDKKMKHIFLLQEKINAYLMALESGQVFNLYPESMDKVIVVSLVLKYEPNEVGKSFLSKVNDVLLNAGYNFEYTVLAS